MNPVFNYSRNPDAKLRPLGKVSKLPNNPETLSPTHLPDVLEVSPTSAMPLPAFMEKWSNDAARLERYELPATGSSDFRPGKRRWQESQEGIGQLHQATRASAEIQTLDEALSQWTALQYRPIREVPQPRESSELVQNVAVTRVSRLPEESLDLDPAVLVRAVKELKLSAQQRTLLDLAEKNSFEEMVEFVRPLEPDHYLSLIKVALAWRDGSSPCSNLPASQLMALLLLFTRHSIRPIDLLKLLPPTWPRALEHLRQACLDWRADLRPHSWARVEVLAELMQRYGVTSQRMV